MKLARLALLDLGSTPHARKEYQLDLGKSRVWTHPVNPTSGSTTSFITLLVATTPLEQALTQDNSGFLVVPSAERVYCEQAIEVAANILSVLGGCSRSISSPIPAVAIDPDGDSTDWLERTRGFRQKMVSRLLPNIEIPPSPEIFDRLADRIDGVALLAEAYSASSDLDKYRGYIRFFEHAFALPATQLSKKLTRFLQTEIDLRYTRNEVSSWIEPRHATIHADLRKQKSVATTSAIKPFIDRMTQAAVDVLLHKARWHDKSKERRKQLWRSAHELTSRDGQGRLLAGTPFRMRGQILDEFDVYPVRLIDGCLSGGLPSPLWHKSEDDNDYMPSSTQPESGNLQP